MKARVKATGEIVDVTRIVDRYVMTHHPHTITFEKDELDFDIENDHDYWTRLEHQAAIAAMQGILAHEGLEFRNYLPQEAMGIAHALVEKMKEAKA